MSVTGAWLEITTPNPNIGNVRVGFTCMSLPIAIAVDWLTTVQRVPALLFVYSYCRMNFCRAFGGILPKNMIIDATVKAPNDGVIILSGKGGKVEIAVANKDYLEHSVVCAGVC